MKIIPAMWLLFLLTPLAGCMNSLTGDSYSREEARAVHQVEYATIISMRPVVIEGTKTPIGPAIGGVLGGIGGSSVGGGKGQAAATVVGAAVGAAAGAAAEEAMTRRQGDEYTLQRENGQVISVVQERSPHMQLHVGDRVRILRSNGTVRISN